MIMLTSTSIYNLQGQFSRIISEECFNGLIEKSFSVRPVVAVGLVIYSHFNSPLSSAIKNLRLSLTRSYENNYNRNRK